VIAEELGFVGVIDGDRAVRWLVMRAFAIGRRRACSSATSPALVAQGIGLWIGVQAIINMGVNMGVLPTKGLTLPLMSFGGSAIVANCMALAILLRIDWEEPAAHAGGMRCSHAAPRRAPADHGRRHRRPHLSRARGGRVLRARGWRIVWLGNPRRHGGALVPKRGYPWPGSASRRCAARGCCASCCCRSTCCVAFWQARARDLRAHRPTWCWAWAAT
jgi:hypothetical protein